MSARDNLIKGLRDLADWLEANPAAPYGDHEIATVQHSVDIEHPAWPDAVREVDRLAEALGLEAGALFNRDARYYGITKQFGPALRYTALAIKERRDRS